MEAERLYALISNIDKKISHEYNKSCDNLVYLAKYHNSMDFSNNMMRHELLNIYCDKLKMAALESKKLYNIKNQVKVSNIDTDLYMKLMSDLNKIDTNLNLKLNTRPLL